MFRVWGLGFGVQDKDLMSLNIGLYMPGIVIISRIIYPKT